MSIVPPIGRYLESPFSYAEDIEVNRHPDGTSRGRQFGVGYWHANIALAQMDRKALGQWEAFLLKYGSAKEVVRLFQPNQCRPVAYKSFDGVNIAGGGAFDGRANLFTRTDAFNVTVDQCPSLFELTASDWVGFEIDGRFSLHRVMGDVIGGAGGVVSIEVFPAIPARFVAGSIVHFEKPMGEFLIEPGSIQKSRVGRKTALRFSATSQV